MAEKNIIQLNPTKSSTAEFDVTILGLENTTPTVRVVVLDVMDGVDWIVPCTRLEDNKWQAIFPAFVGIKLTSRKFCVEVIVDEYFFKPIEGKIVFIGTPDVSVKSVSNEKPTVLGTFTGLGDDQSSKKVVKEAAGGPEITGQYAPTNALLKPEEDPTATQSHVKMAQAALDDQYIDKARLDDITDEDPIPGEGEQYTQDDGKGEWTDDEIEPEEDAVRFDLDKTVESILNDMVPLGLSPDGMGTINKKGSLFKRDADGKIIVPGLENPKQKRELADREQRVKDILKQ